MAKGRKRGAASRKGKKKMCKKAPETSVVPDNLNSSAATSMNPVASPTDTVSSVLSSPAANVTNNASNDSLVEPNLLRNMENNVPIDTGIQNDSDEDIQYIGEKRYVADHLNNNSSAVTNMNMRCPTAENNFIVENAYPVASSLASLPPTDNLANLLSSPDENTSKFLTIQKYLKSLQECKATLDPPIMPDLFPGTENNFPIDTENQDELDDDGDVQYIGEQRDVGEIDFNPAAILTVLMEQEPVLKEFVERSRYISDAFIVQLYAILKKDANNLGKLSKLTIELRQCKSQLEKALHGKEGVKALEAKRTELQEYNKWLESQLADLIRNTKTEIASYKIFFTKGYKSSAIQEIQDKLEADFLATINKKDKKIRDQEEKEKKIKETYRCLKKKMEEEAQRLMEEEQSTQLQQSSPRSISEYKRKHYCRVCDRPAAIVCCLHNSYCSSECQERHSEEHRKLCKSKI